MNSLIISLIVLFWCSCCWEGMIFEGIKKIINPEWKIAKPIYQCPICATPWWGSLIYWVFIHVSVLDWLFVIGGASGFSVLWVIGLSIREACEKYLEDIKDNQKQ